MRFIARFRARFIVRFGARFIVRFRVRFRARLRVRTHAGGSQTLSGFSNLSKYFVCRISHYFFQGILFSIFSYKFYFRI